MSIFGDFSFILCFACFRVRLPFWPYAKGVINIFLVIQCFACDCYVYNHFVRSYISGTSILGKLDCLSVDSIPSEGGFISSEPDHFVHVVEKIISESEVHESNRCGARLVGLHF